MRSTFLLGAAGALLAATALAQTVSTAEFVKKVALSDMLEIQASEFIAPHADALGSNEALRQVGDIARSNMNDATWLRGVFDRERSLHEAVRQQCLQWRE